MILSFSFFRFTPFPILMRVYPLITSSFGTFFFCCFFMILAVMKICNFISSSTFKKFSLSKAHLRIWTSKSFYFLYGNVVGRMLNDKLFLQVLISLSVILCYSLSWICRIHKSSNSIIKHISLWLRCSKLVIFYIFCYFLKRVMEEL